VLTSLKSPLPRLLVERWGRTLGTRDRVGDGVWCVTCLAYEDLPDKQSGQLMDELREYARALPKDTFDVWQEEVLRRVGPTRRDRWDRIFPPEARPSLIDRWRNRDGDGS
jgi:hypothetical protein